MQNEIILKPSSDTLIYLMHDLEVHLQPYSKHINMLYFVRHGENNVLPFPLEAFIYDLEGLNKIAVRPVDDDVVFVSVLTRYSVCWKSKPLFELNPSVKHDIVLVFATPAT